MKMNSTKNTEELDGRKMGKQFLLSDIEMSSEYINYIIWLL